jgi:hypothetical protein
VDGDSDLMNNLYLVIYLIRTNISLTESIRFQQNNVEITISEDPLYHDENCSEWLSRLIVKVEISDSTIESAISKAFESVDRIVGLLSFQMGVTIDYPIFDKAIDISKGTKDRSFVQNVPVPYNLGTKRPLNLNEFDIFFQSLSQEDIPHLSKHSPRIGRAIRWYRKGISETDTLTRFTQFWIGLEVLNPIISEKYRDNIVSDPQFYLPEDPSKLIPLNGVKFFFIKRMKQAQDFWKECIGIRKDIVHGIKLLDEIKENARKNNPIVEKALQKAVLDCLNIPDEEIEKISHESYHSSGDVKNRISVVLTNAPLNLIKNDKLPFFEANSALKMDEKNGEATGIELRVQFKLKNYEGSYRPLYSELYGKIDPETNPLEISSSFTIKKDRIGRFFLGIRKLIKR